MTNTLTIQTQGDQDPFSFESDVIIIQAPSHRSGVNQKRETLFEVEKVIVVEEKQEDPPQVQDNGSVCWFFKCLC